MLRDYFSGADVPNEGDPFPELGLSVDQTGLVKPKVSPVQDGFTFSFGEKLLQVLCGGYTQAQAEQSEGHGVEGEAAGPCACVEALVQASP